MRSGGENEAARKLGLDAGHVSAVVNKKRKRAGKYEFEYAEASEPARLEGERWVDIDVEKLRGEDREEGIIQK